MRQGLLSRSCFVLQICAAQVGLGFSSAFEASRLPQDPSGLGGIDSVDGQIFDLVGCQFIDWP